MRDKMINQLIEENMKSNDNRDNINFNHFNR